MCGRFTLRAPTPVLAKSFRLELTSNLTPRFNIAPTQSVLTIHQTGDRLREAANLHWGLIPSWSKDPSGAARRINCRCETAADKPSFRSAFRKRRCLVIADGYFEWERVGKQRLPWFIHLANQQPFAMAGLYETWRPKESSQTDHELSSCTILTTSANTRTANLHDRMPVILSRRDEEVWLDPQLQTQEELEHLFDPYPSDEMNVRPVSTFVNNARHEGEACLEPRPTQGELF